MLPMIGMSQSGMIWKKFMVADTLSADTTIAFPTSGTYTSWSVSIVVGSTTSTASTVKIQVSPNGVDYVDYADLQTATLTSGTMTAFEDSFASFRWMRLVFAIESGKSVPVNAWYIFKK